MKYRNVDGVTADGLILDEITLTSKTVVVNDSFVGTVIDGSAEPIVAAPGAAPVHEEAPDAEVNARENISDTTNARASLSQAKIYDQSRLGPISKENWAGRQCDAGPVIVRRLASDVLSSGLHRTIHSTGRMWVRRALPVRENLLETLPDLGAETALSARLHKMPDRRALPSYKWSFRQAEEDSQFV